MAVAGGARAAGAVADALRTAKCAVPPAAQAQVGRKSASPRLKKYYDESQQVCEVAVYRYYCRNPQCAQGSFTQLPPGLVPYSRYRPSSTCWPCKCMPGATPPTGAPGRPGRGQPDRLALGQRLGLCLVARGGPVWRGQVERGGRRGREVRPGAQKRQAGGAMRRWMYVYLAVDVWTYDLLHIAIYPYNNDRERAEPSLLAVRAKGYHPQVIVTDLRQDYGPVIALVFPQAVHHLCIFHALQAVQQHIKDVYGPDYAQQHPEAERLKQPDLCHLRRRHADPGG